MKSILGEKTHKTHEKWGKLRMIDPAKGCRRMIALNIYVDTFDHMILFFMKIYARGKRPSNNCVYSFYLGEVALCRISFWTTWKRSLRNFHQPGPCETKRSSSLLPFPAGAWFHKQPRSWGVPKIPENNRQVCVFLFLHFIILCFFW